MDQPINRQVVLASRPEGIPQAENFRLVTSPRPTRGPGQILVQNLFLSVEPAMRGWVNAVGNYAKPVAIDEVMRSFALGRIIESDHPDCPVGAHVTGMFGWQDFAVVEPSAIDHLIHQTDLPLSVFLGVLGINGVTAHYGLLKIGEPQAGNTVVVSTGAGSVGSCVGQIARIKGCRTVSITGGETKRQLSLDRFGYDSAVDYFDNTSGAISDAVMHHLNVGARIIICGTASVANWNPPPLGPRVERHILVKRARMQGFVILDHLDHYPVARAELTAWLRPGLIHYEEELLDGIAQAPDAIAGLYRGDNLGKRLIRL